MTAIVNGAGLGLAAGGLRSARRAVQGCIYAMLTFIGLAAATPASATDPAVQFMAKVGREITAAARTRSPGVMSSVVQRYADVSYIGLFSLGNYRAQLAATERPNYYSGMVKFIGRYAANEAPKYTVAKVEWSDQSIRGANGIMVDSKVTLTDGSTYDVRWLVVQQGGNFKVRDAMVVGFWMTPFLKKLFEDYIAQNGGNPRALITALNR